MKYLKILNSYLRYRKNAVDAFGVHAPFLFNLLQEVVYQKSDNKEFVKIENIRKSLLKNHSTIIVRDLGAGSRAENGRQRKIANIAKYSSKPPKYTALIYRIIKYLKPQTILEIGTSFGISTMYMAQANAQANIVTLEGCPATAAIAQQNFDSLQMHNIKLIKGNFDETLPGYLNTNPILDFVFFDGNHRKEPTIRYFNQCIEKAHPDSVFVLDDIHWSEEMEAAWKLIQEDPRSQLCLDFYSFGIVFFKKEVSKESFVIRF
jgi:predicted O-methyltransferase YrrM